MRIPSVRLAVLMVSLCCFLFPKGVFAQLTTTSQITGSIFDPANAAVPGAKIKATNSETHLERTATSGPDGSYLILGLDRGTYTITVSAQGFQDYVDASVVVYPAEARRVDVHLAVGKATQTVNVTAQGVVIDTTSAALTSNIPYDQIEYPAGTRGQTGAMYLTQFAPGVQNYATTGRNFINNGDNALATRSDQDGQEGDNRGDFRPTEMMTQQAKIITVDAPAENQLSGTASGVTRSGTNQFHGQVLYDISNEALNSLGPHATTRPAGTPSHVWETEVGGPVRIPKIYNGTNKSFFHFDYQPNRTLYAFPMTSWFNINGGAFPPWVTPYQNMRNGDLSVYTKPIIDPMTSLPFTGNRIPSNRISTVSQNIMKTYWPLPNYGPPNNLTSNLIESGASRPIILNNWNFRIDHQIYSKNNLSVVYFKMDSSDSSNIFYSPVVPRAEHDGVASLWNFIDTQIVSPNVVNIFQVARNHTYDYNIFGNTEAASVLSSLGLNEGVTPTPGIGGAIFSVTGFAYIQPFGNSEDDWYYWTIKDHLSVTKGKHAFAMGADIKPMLPSFVSRQTAWGSFTFDGSITGNPLADFLLGIPNKASLTQPRLPALERWSEDGVFFQDNWRITKKLTMNLGVRYQTYTVATDANHLFYNFDTTNLKVVVPNNVNRSQINPAWPAGIPIVTADQEGYPSALRYGNHFNFEPRIGVAYSPNSKLVIRSGYGIYHVPTPGAQQYETDPLGPSANGPFSPLNINLGPNQVTNGQPQFSFPAPFSAGGSSSPVGLQSVFAVPLHLAAPYTQQWNLTVERDIGRGMSVAVGYVGSHGNNWFYTTELEQPQPSLTPFTIAERPIAPNLFNSIQLAHSGGSESYNALQVVVQRIYSSGLFLRTALTWSKRLSDVADTTTMNYGPLLENTYDLNGYRGIQPGLEPFFMSTAAVYPLPFGRGKRFMSNPSGIAGGLVNQVFGGWVLSTNLFINDGIRYTPTYSGSDPSNTGVFGGRASSICNGNTRSTVFQYWNSSCYIVPLPGTFGDAGVGSLSGPNYWDLDTGLFKDFNLVPVWHDKGPVLRFEVHVANFPNHPNGGISSTDITTPSFGSSSFSGTRTIQFGVSIRF